MFLDIIIDFLGFRVDVLVNSILSIAINAISSQRSFFIYIVKEVTN